MTQLLDSVRHIVRHHEVDEFEREQNDYTEYCFDVFGSRGDLEELVEELQKYDDLHVDNRDIQENGCKDLLRFSIDIDH